MKRLSKTRLTFGPVGTCHSTGVLAPALVQSDATTAADVLNEQLVGGTDYGYGSRGTAAFRVANGQPVLDEGKHTGARPGRAIRHK